jgi:general secretion pathway protein L
MIAGEFWWLYRRKDALYWAHKQAPGGAPLRSGECKSWAALPVPKDATIVLSVPGESVRSYSVELPQRNRRRFLAALPYALEEQLLSEPEAYHFVRLPRHYRSPRIAVAVIEHKAVSAWQDEAGDAGFQLDYLIPDYLMMAAPPADTWMLEASEGPLLLRQPNGQGGAALMGEICAAIPGALMLALESASPRPTSLRVRVRTDVQRELVEGWSEGLQQYGLALDIVQDPRNRAAWLASRPLPAEDFNMLVGPYARGPGRGAWGMPGLRTVALALLLTGTLAADFSVGLSHLRQEHAALQANLEKALLEAFPETRQVVDPRFQLEQGAERLRKAVHGSDAARPLMEWLAPVGAALSEEKDIALRMVALEESGFVVEVQNAGPAALDVIKARLRSLGPLTVEELGGEQTVTITRLHVGRST